MRFRALKKISKIKKTISLVLLTLSLSLLIAPSAFAGFSDWAGQVVGGIIYIFIWGVGLIVMLVMKVLLKVIAYQHFIDVQAVIQGWAIVRDVANMFFVAVLLVIAFATILHIEEYNYKKWLPKLILMAILINFSKTICGVLIDITQVVMLTFVNSFRSVAGGNFVEMLGIRDVVTFAKESTDDGFWTIVGAYILGLIYMIIALVVLTTMLMMLVMRLVMIWIYVVLSPLAYLLSAFPGGAKYASKWWTDFTSNLIVGPVLAFFIWLSFAALQTTTDIDKFGDADTGEGNFVTNSDDGMNSPTVVTQASTPGVLIKFIIGIGMLIGGMKIAQEVGGAAGSIAGKGMGKLNMMAAAVTGVAGGSAVSAAKFAGRTALGAGAGLTKLGGMGLGAISGGKLGKGMQAMGQTGLDLRKDLIADKEKSKVEGRKKFLRKIGASADTADKFNERFEKNRNNQATVNGTALMTMGAAGGAAFGPGGAIIGGVAGALGAGALRLIGGFRDNQVTKAKGNLEAKEQDLTDQRNNYNTVLAASGGDETHPAVRSAKDDLDAAQEEVTTAKNNLQIKEGKGGSFMAEINKAVDGVTKFTTDLTAKAAKGLAEDKKYGRQQVELMAKNPSYLDGAAPAAIYSTTGQTGPNAAIVSSLIDKDNLNAPQAIANLENRLRTYIPGAVGGGGMDKVVRALAQDIAASDKKGEDVSRLNGLVTLINSKASGTSPDVLDTVDNYKNQVIPYRQTGVVGEQGSGTLYVDSMAAGKENHQLAGVDFNKLKEKGYDIETSADGAFIKGDDMAKFGTVLSQVINDARQDLEAAYSGGLMEREEYVEKFDTLGQADKKLKDGSFKESGMMLVNSGGANFGRNAKLTTAYHEAVHKGGIDDEGIAEGLAVALMNGKLYGRNATTGGSHVAEITALAKAMKAGGANNDDILKAMSAEIAQRSKNETDNRAARVVAQTKGEAPTQSQAIGVKEEPVVTVDTARLEAAIESAFSGSSKTKGLIDPGPQLDAIRRVIQTGTKTQTKGWTKLASTISGSKNTPLAVKVAVDAMSAETEK